MSLGCSHLLFATRILTFFDLLAGVRRLRNVLRPVGDTTGTEL